MSEPAKNKAQPAPCPFCGSTAQYNHEFGVVECDSCGAVGPGGIEGVAVDAWNRRAAPAQAVEADSERIYVTCHQCDNCQHIGINDEHPTESACNRGLCAWHGPSPAQDVCPGCGEHGTMSTACPECGGHYVLLAEDRIALPAARAALSASPAAAPCPHVPVARRLPRSSTAADRRLMGQAQPTGDCNG